MEHTGFGLPKKLRDAANGICSMKTDKGDFGLLEDAADEIDRLRRALQPFADFAENNIEGDGWGGARSEKDRIYVWFGPSDFISARAAIADKET